MPCSSCSSLSSLYALSTTGIRTTKLSSGPILSPFTLPSNPNPNRSIKRKPDLTLALPRRLILPSAASALWKALTGADPARDAAAAIRKGMLLFRQGDVSGSMVEFDRAIELDSRQKALCLAFATTHMPTTCLVLVAGRDNICLIHWHAPNAATEHTPTNPSGHFRAPDLPEEDPKLEH